MLLHHPLWTTLVNLAPTTCVVAGGLGTSLPARPAVSSILRRDNCKGKRADALTPFALPDERDSTASTSKGSECPRGPVSLGLESRILKRNFASAYVTISRPASPSVRKRFELSTKCFSSSSGTNASRPASLFSSSSLSFNFFLYVRHVGFSSFDPRLNFQKRAPSKRNDRSQQVSCSSCRRIMAFLQSPPSLQRVLPRVGNSVTCPITREIHERCVHLL